MLMRSNIKFERSTALYKNDGIHHRTRKALSRAHLPPTKVFRRLRTTRRCSDGRPIPMLNTYTWDFPDVIKFRAVHMISEKAIRFRHPDYGADEAQKLISSSTSQHLSTRKISTKSMHAFLSNLANRQTDSQIDSLDIHRWQSHLPPPLSGINSAAT